MSIGPLRPTVKTHVIVVLSFHGRTDTLRCVESLVAGSPDATVLVVDNGSKDGTLEEVALRWPQAHALQAGTNLGFAGGMNLGLRWALDAGAATITVLNNDTIAPIGLAARLAAVASPGRAVSPTVLVEPAEGTRDPQKATVWFGGGAVDAGTGMARHTGPEEWGPTDGDGLRPTATLAGCWVTAPAQVWRRVGLFDERYFLNFEDAEWSRRAADLGVPLCVDTRSVLWHRVSASFVGPYRYLGAYYYVRNGLLFVRTSGTATMLTPWRFLRHHCLGAALRRQPDEPAREPIRRGLVLAWAVAAAYARRFGPAPRKLVRLVERWSWATTDSMGK